MGISKRSHLALKKARLLFDFASTGSHAKHITRLVLSTYILWLFCNGFMEELDIPGGLSGIFLP